MCEALVLIAVIVGLGYLLFRFHKSVNEIDYKEGGGHD